MADSREEGLIRIDGWIEKIRAETEKINTLWLKAVGKRLRELNGLDPSDEAGINAIRNDTEFIADVIDMFVKAGEDKTEDRRNLLRMAARLSVEASPVAGSLPLESWINGIAEATEKEFRFYNLAHTTTVGVVTPSGFKSASEAYIEAIDRVSAQMGAGEMGLKTATRSVLKQFADAGLSTVEYASGRHRSLGSAVEMNLREAVSRVYQGVQKRIGQEYGADGVEVSAHWDCAPDHLDVQGKQYTNEEFEALQSTLARPIGTLNCRHITYAIIIGLSPKTYSDTELQAMKDASMKTTVFDGKEMTKYEASQVQRKLERAIRKQKNRTVIAKAAGDDVMRREAQMNITQLTKKYSDLSNKTGLPTKAGRMTVSDYKKVKATKKIDPGGVERIRRPDELNLVISDGSSPAVSKSQEQALAFVKSLFSSEFEEKLIEESLMGGGYSRYIVETVKYKDKSLKSAARQYIRNLNEHLNAIENPLVHDKMYCDRPEGKQIGAFRNWERDAEKARSSLIIILEELKKRGYDVSDWK